MEKEEEIWKEISGFENYQVSSFGRVKSLGNNKKRKEKILKQNDDGDGYLHVKFCKDGKEQSFRVHRLVAQAFIPNPNNFPQVNHKDENKANNRVENLEWCTHEFNSNYGTRNQRISEANTNHPSKSKAVVQLTLDGEFVAEYSSSKEAQRNGFHRGNIISCCRGKRKTHKGYLWQYY